MTQTNNLNITLLEQSQAQKEVSINSAIVVIDAILNRGAIDVISTPPVSPNNGDVYITGIGASGAWLNNDKKIAYYNQSWQFISPKEGCNLWVSAKNKFFVFQSNFWVEANSVDNNFATLGINGTADVNNKLLVKSNDVLLASNTGDVRLKLNKNLLANNATILMQNNYSTRAEFGVNSSDNFEIKVSADGSTFKQAIVVDKATAQVDVKENSYFVKPIKLQGYTIATLPPANVNAGSIAYVSNGAAGLPIVAFSDGASWLRLDTRTALS